MVKRMATKAELFCKTHNKKVSQKTAQRHHHNGCDVWYLDPATGELSRRYGSKKEPPKASVSGIGVPGAEIAEHLRGLKEPAPEILFIYYTGGKVERFWDRFPDHQSIFTALVQGGFFTGTAAEFVEASARFMLAAAGYESAPCIIPANMKAAYDETARLIQEGALVVNWGDNGKMKLEIKETEGDHAGHTITEEGVQPGNDTHQPRQVSPGEEKEPSQAK